MKHHTFLIFIILRIKHLYLCNCPSGTNKVIWTGNWIYVIELIAIWIKYEKSFIFCSDLMQELYLNLPSTDDNTTQRYWVYLDKSCWSFNIFEVQIHSEDEITPKQPCASTCSDTSCSVRRLRLICLCCCTQRIDSVKESSSAWIYYHCFKSARAHRLSGSHLTLPVPPLDAIPFLWLLPGVNVFLRSLQRVILGV